MVSTSVLLYTYISVCIYIHIYIYLSLVSIYECDGALKKRVYIFGGSHMDVCLKKRGHQTMVGFLLGLQFRGWVLLRLAGFFLLGPFLGVVLKETQKESIHFELAVFERQS